MSRTVKTILVVLSLFTASMFVPADATASRGAAARAMLSKAVTR